MSNQLMAEPLQLLTVDEAIDQLKIGRTMLYKLINTGKLQKIKLGTKTFVTNKSIEKFICELVEEI
ncbi:MAG: helix-turn-helix domain-containing protein [Acidimicrobiales bacterium]|nr:helix-turn-helix domain-containing protein [Acidimicrobiales bacterium]